MTTYRYKGQTKDGTAVSGVIRAYDEFEAASRLRETVAVITRLEEVQEKKENIFNRPIGLKIKEKELALICSQFAIILSAGMSIQHCVEMVAAQTRNRHIRQMLEKVAEEVGAGYSMAQSFENNAPYLPKTFIETVRAGEQSGTLEECFQRLHRYYDKSAKTKAKVVSTLTYPAMVIVVAIVVFIIIIAVAVPAFNDVFAETAAFRRDIHMHPELSEHEARTEAKICARLDELGIPYEKDIAGHGVCATVYGQSTKKTVAIRADIRSAIRIPERRRYARLRTRYAHIDSTRCRQNPQGKSGLSAGDRSPALPAIRRNHRRRQTDDRRRLPQES